MTDDIVAFIRARLDEDQAAANAATPGPWEPEGDDPTDDEVWTRHDGEHGDLVGDRVAFTRGPRSQPTTVHIARHDPDRVLRGVEARRAILHEHCDDGPWQHAEDGSLVRSGPLGKHCTTCVDTTAYYSEDWTLEPYPCRTLRLLASEWSTHEAYRTEWTP